MVGKEDRSGITDELFVSSGCGEPLIGTVTCGPRPEIRSRE